MRNCSEDVRSHARGPDASHVGPLIRAWAR